MRELIDNEAGCLVYGPYPGNSLGEFRSYLPN